MIQGPPLWSWSDWWALMFHEWRVVLPTMAVFFLLGLLAGAVECLQCKDVLAARACPKCGRRVEVK